MKLQYIYFCSVILLIYNSVITGSAQNTKNINIGLLIVATGKYTVFVEPLITSARTYFCPDATVTYYVFTDGFIPQAPDIVPIFQKRLGWPYDTLLRCTMYCNHKNIFEKEDYLFSCDADMRFNNTILAENIIGTRVCTLHAGFINKRGTYETNPRSRAYVADNEGIYYFVGGFYGGSRDEFIKQNECMSKNIVTDLVSGYIAIWHDESHLNRYYIDNPPTRILSPAFCYPEHKYMQLKPYLLALDKNHAAMRE